MREVISAASRNINVGCHKSFKFASFNYFIMFSAIKYRSRIEMPCSVYFISRLLHKCGNIGSQSLTARHCSSGQNIFHKALIIVPSINVKVGLPQPCIESVIE